MKEQTMPRRQRSPLAKTLKQNRPFVSLEQEVYLSILRTASELSYAVDQFFRQFDITQSQYNVLRILRGAGADGDCDARHVAPAGSHGEGGTGYAKKGRG